MAPAMPINATNGTATNGRITLVALLSGVLVTGLFSVVGADVVVKNEPVLSMVADGVRSVAGFSVPLVIVGVGSSEVGLVRADGCD